MLPRRAGTLEDPHMIPCIGDRRMVSCACKLRADKRAATAASHRKRRLSGADLIELVRVS